MSNKGDQIGELLKTASAAAPDVTKLLNPSEMETC